MAENVSESLDTLTLTSPLELMGNEFERIAIIGVGLIGGSIGLRMKSMDHAGTIVGHDKPDVLNEALERGAIDRGVGDLAEAVAEMDLIVLATPVDETVKLLPTVLRIAKNGSLVTDTAAVKSEVFRTAQNVKDARAQYIGGHPLAGSDRQGIANADAALFDCAYWLLTPAENVPPALKESLSWWVRMLGGYPIVLNAEQHDRIMAVTSHVPFVIALALSLWVAKQSGEEPLLSKLATGTFRTMTGTAGLPLDAWEAVIHANQADVEKALKEFAGILKECAVDLHSGKLADVWQQAYGLQRKLSRERPGDWDANCELIVTAQDRPGTIAQIAGLLAHHDIGIRDIHVIYIRERRGGTLAVVLASRAEARQAMEILNMNGYSVRMKD